MITKPLITAMRRRFTKARGDGRSGLRHGVGNDGPAADLCDDDAVSRRVQLYAGRNEFKTDKALSASLSRSGVKETTLNGSHEIAERQHADRQFTTQEFAARWGIAERLGISSERDLSSREERCGRVCRCMWREWSRLMIPDFIPVVGYLDDLIIVPLGVLLAIRLIPPEVMAEHRFSAAKAADRPVSRIAAVIIIGIWIAAFMFIVWFVWRQLAKGN